MKRYILILLSLIIVSSLVSAGDLPTGTLGECVDLYQHCSDCTSVNVTSIQFPNNTVGYRVWEMDRSGTDFTYHFCYVNQTGRYFYTVCGNPEDSNKEPCKTFTFDVTYNGKVIDSSTSILYIGFLSVLVILFLVVIYTIPKIPVIDVRDEFGILMQINNLKHLRPVLYGIAWLILLTILYVSSNIAIAYIPTGLIGQTLFTLFIIMFIVTIIAAPIWFIVLLANIFRDREVKRMIERGAELGGDV